MHSFQILSMSFLTVFRCPTSPKSMVNLKKVEVHCEDERCLTTEEFERANVSELVSLVMGQVDAGCIRTYSKSLRMLETTD